MLSDLELIHQAVAPEFVLEIYGCTDEDCPRQYAMTQEQGGRISPENPLSCSCGCVCEYLGVTVYMPQHERFN